MSVPDWKVNTLLHRVSDLEHTNRVLLKKVVKLEYGFVEGDVVWVDTENGPVMGEISEVKPDYCFVALSGEKLATKFSYTSLTKIGV